jgi:hypothetical protein
MSYPLATWAKVRLDYENGVVRSTKELGKKYGISQKAIEVRIEKEFWLKAVNVPLIKESMQQQFIAALERQGVGVDYLAGKVKELMEATNALIINGEEFGKAKDWTAIAKGLSEANKILGTYAPVKTEIDINIKIKAVIAQVVPIIQEFVPENKRNEVANRLGSING